MTRLITQSELETLTEVELRSKFNQVVNEISHKRKEMLIEYQLMLTSLQNIEKELCRKKTLTNP